MYLLNFLHCAYSTQYAPVYGRKILQISGRFSSNVIKNRTLKFPSTDVLRKYVASSTIAINLLLWEIEN